MSDLRIPGFENALPIEGMELTIDNSVFPEGRPNIDLGPRLITGRINVTVTPSKAMLSRWTNRALLNVLRMARPHMGRRQFRRARARMRAEHRAMLLRLSSGLKKVAGRRPDIIVIDDPWA